MEIKNLRELQAGEKWMFDAVIKQNELTVYGCQYICKGGKRFVAGPQRKGSDDKWYNVVYLGKELSGKIQKLVESMVDSARAGKDTEDIPF